MPPSRVEPNRKPVTHYGSSSSSIGFRIASRAVVRPHRPAVKVRVCHVYVAARPRESHRRIARTIGARGDPDSDSEPPPKRPYELGPLDAASSRLWAHVRRREAKGRAAVV